MPQEETKKNANNACHIPAAMSDRDFDRFSQLITSELGIKIPPTKKVMLQARLQKRLRCLGIKSFKDYCQYVFEGNRLQDEFQNLTDVVTTNTTEFFREPRHFEFLTKSLLPTWLKDSKTSRPLRLWSAGCSSGEEPYTLAMVLSEFKAAHPSFSYSITATDISSDVLQRALRGIYPEDRTLKIPLAVKRKYFLRSKDRNRGMVRITPELRSQVTFGQLNFMKDFTFPEKMDVIFCRNVMIYFDRAIQEGLVQRFCRDLRPGGFLFIGHSESLNNMALPLSPVAPTIYQRNE